ncbi:conserved exported protein of unknown function [Rhodovastum atsumiense]|uniref:DUF1194 domain-containing protein n=1 Tax=Rhodovastum atsumiense TaxID=504468 RepID=A0A5M6IVN0_9PROT|nr:DUF1194 domain-containing protein [Rhodovastum atsumiense]KAA5612374.1 DUF1194 domain-containing protein [Rhodovastum atsumiense]CAH2600273.1 conserved exported protein of unknown function [Rhodovastum atsumiense]
MRWLLMVSLLVASLLPSPRARAAEPVDLLLTLVTDVSRSVDDAEFALEKEGYRIAFTSGEVIEAIRSGPLGAIAVTYIEFASGYEVRTVVDWTVIRDEPSAQAFAQKLRDAPRSFWGRTAIGAGMEHALKALETAPFEAQRRVIDVCGDGTNNNGPDVELVRDRAVESGVVVNGLAIVNENPVSWTFAHVQPPGGLPNWYREHVIGGPGSFVIEIQDFRSFGAAMTRKLISEIAMTDGASPLFR